MGEKQIWEQQFKSIQRQNRLAIRLHTDLTKKRYKLTTE